MAKDMTYAHRATIYNTCFPDRPPLAYNHDWITGTWAIGACYKNPNTLYGAYPYGYLKRVHKMFPDARNILHIFSGGMSKDAALSELDYQPDRMELVDCKGPEDGRYPTWQGSVLELPEEWNDCFDLILADPPYSTEDAEKYNVPMVNRGAVTTAVRRVCKKGGTMVWLDTQWPMHQKKCWKTYGHIGLVRSTQHRMRLVTFFEAQ